MKEKPLLRGCPFLLFLAGDCASRRGRCAANYLVLNGLQRTWLKSAGNTLTMRTSMSDNAQLRFRLAGSVYHVGWDARRKEPKLPQVSARLRGAGPGAPGHLLEWGSLLHKATTPHKQRKLVWGTLQIIAGVNRRYHYLRLAPWPHEAGSSPARISLNTLLTARNRGSIHLLFGSPASFPTQWFRCVSADVCSAKT